MKTWSILFAILLNGTTHMTNADWEPGDGPLLTRWAKEVLPTNVLPEYPRPQMVREQWLNLNGLWQFAIAQENEPPPIGKELPEEILVPFPVESALSGVMKRAERVWYRRMFNVDDWLSANRHFLLHFGAVDWEATVWINGKEVGTHRGGYDPLAFDITDALKPSGEQEIVVGVFDPTDNGTQPRGKQVNQPHGIWYTPTTGIWQTVWLEPLPETSIRSLQLTPNVDSGQIDVRATYLGSTRGRNLRAAVVTGDRTVVAAIGSPMAALTLEVPDVRRWSPDDPFLYDLVVQLRQGEQVIDEVRSYFGLRKISLGSDRKGMTRVMLNNEPLFQIGVLDQGFWPDGLYTAPTDAALRYDIEVLKQLGYNLARKHVKIEPDRWYYWCDKLGLLVWQDMPSGDKYIGGNDPDLERSPESAQQFELELRRLIESRFNHPSIIMWVVFNEGWGQYDTARLTDRVHKLDPTRLVNSASGWTDRGVGSVHDVHAYPGPASPKPERKRAAVLGEFGGLGLPLEGHTWTDKKNWGYRNLTSREELTERYVQLIERLRFLIGDPGLCAAVYTQVSDVETECNGLMTYDRAIVKPDVEQLAAAHAKLHLPPPVIKTIVPSSRERGLEWRYTVEKPGDDWFKADFDDATWASGLGGFGTEGTPGAVVRTEWKTGEIWLRRSFTLAAEPWASLQLLVHHDEDVEIYINGVLACAASGYAVSYELFPPTAEGREALHTGENTIAVHCKQTGGGQYIDVGIVEVIEK
jgi:hypothetical protein